MTKWSVMNIPVIISVKEEYRRMNSLEKKLMAISYSLGSLALLTILFYAL